MKILMAFTLVALALVSTDSARAAGVLPNEAAVNNLLADRISETLAKSPQTRGLYVQVDAWNGLAVLHGWTLNKWQRRTVENVVKGIEGVDAVFNFMTSDDDFATVDQLAREGRRIQIAMGNSYESSTDVSGWPVTNVTSSREGSPILPKTPIVQALPNRVGQIVKYRLDIAPFTGMHEITVNSYEGLIILHGMAPSARFAREAESIAAHTAGVQQVYSYIKTPEAAEAVLLSDEPVLVELTRDRESERALSGKSVYARYEENVQVKSHCDRCDH
jgi:osmotically-inducible protein OsmY